MAHRQQQQFVRWARDYFPGFFSGKRVLEIGSLDINGSVRSFFENCAYTGIDVGAGPGVDVVCPGQEYDAPSGTFDVVGSFEAMEHNPFWRETFQNMIRLTRPGGMIIMSCATSGRREHGTSRTTPADSPLTRKLGWDYYRNLTSLDFATTVNLEESFACSWFAHYYESCDLYFIGFRRGALPPENARSATRALSLKYAARNLFRLRALATMISVKLVALRSDGRGANERTPIG